MAQGRSAFSTPGVIVAWTASFMDLSIWYCCLQDEWGEEGEIDHMFSRNASPRSFASTNERLYRSSGLDCLSFVCATRSGWTDDFKSNAVKGVLSSAADQSQVLIPKPLLRENKDVMASYLGCKLLLSDSVIMATNFSLFHLLFKVQQRSQLNSITEWICKSLLVTGLPILFSASCCLLKPHHKVVTVECRQKNQRSCE